MTTLFCAELLRPMACCVLDSLTARGWRAEIETGDAARNALRRFRDPSVGLRVLCVADPMPEETAAALTRALDPYNRKDLLVLHFKTPRDVIEAMERFVGIKQPRRRRSARPLGRSTRSYLSHQTLVEQQVQLGRWSGYGLATAATTTVVAAALHFGIGSHAGSPPVARTTSTPIETAADVASPLVDRAVLSAAAASPIDRDIEAPRQRHSRRSAAGRKQLNPETQPMQSAAISTPFTALEPALEIPADVEDLGELPLEEIGEELIIIDDEIPASTLALATRGGGSEIPGGITAGAPTLRRAPTLHTIDPFATPSASAEF